jgi:WD40 repeat protein
MNRALSNDESSRLPHVGRRAGRSNTRRSSAPTSRSFGLSRVFSGLVIRRSSETSEDLKGPLGLEPLAIPAEPMVDFVFVHGLGGGSRMSWSKGQDPALFWPKYWLPRDPEFRNVRIHSFGYDADWTERRTSILDLGDFGNKLLTALQLSEWIRRSATLPIVFIAHSMGGLVVKHAFVLSQTDPNYQGLGNRFHTMFFLATPHHGAQSSQLLSAILKATDHGHRPFVDDLHNDSPAIQRINDSFRHHAHKVGLFSFFETKPHVYGVRNKDLVVTKASAIMGLPNERFTHLDADHRGVNKFDTPDDPNYVTVRNAFVETLDVIRQNCERITSLKVSLLTIAGETSNRELARTQKRRVRKFLGLTSDTVAEDILDFDEPRAEGSCEWMSETSKFRHWRDESAANVMAVFALPAMGKSYMADFVREHLQALGHPCSTFFFQAGEVARSSLSKCLIHLAYDIACLNPGVRDAFLEMEDDDVHIEHDQEKPRHIWQKLFVNCILKQTLYRPFYWVIDALDECKKVDDLLPLISGISPDFPLRIFITSRPSHELENQLSHLQPPAEIVEILPQNTLEDIKHYVQSHTSFLDHEQPKVRQQLINTILEKSEGCFLWVRLVLKELKQVQSSRITQKILQQMPKGMDKLYNRTLREMATASPYTKPLTKAILRWALCSIRPLTVDELKHALMIDIEDEVQNLVHQIPSLCGHLLFVDPQRRVRLVHQTARSFLLDPENGSEFAFAERQGHRQIAFVCLTYLSGSELRAPRARRPSHQHLMLRSPFLPYAATCFYEHLRYCSTTDEEIFDLLCSFLRDPHRNVLSWIEYIATGKDLGHLVRTGMILATYLKRRAKHLPALGEAVKTVDRWSIDLIRLITKFGHNVTRAPSSIFNIIPPLCPRESALYTLYGKNPRGISVTGLSSILWDDRLASLAFPDVMLSSMACSPGHFAIGASDKYIRLYNTSTCQVLARLFHAEPLKVLEFNISGQLLLSAGRKYARIWDVTGRECVLEVPIPRACIAATFTDDSKNVLLACLDNRIYTHSLSGGGPPDVEQLYADVGHSRNISRPPDTAAFSSQHKLLAFVYRGGHINIWNWEEDVFEGTCEKPEARTQTLPFHATSLVFNPQADADSLAAAYEDGRLIIFNPLDGKIKATFKADASAPTLACSSDGRTLVSGDSSGTIRAFDFETIENQKLKMIHVIHSHADNIRALAFCDNLRFVDIRESQSNIWEPAALVRQERDDEVSDTLSVDLQEQALPEIVEKDEITCVDLDSQSGFIFAGTEAGFVKVYDIETGQTCQTLYTHGVPVTRLVYDQQTQILASADSASRVFTQRLSCRNEKWKVESKLLGGGHRMKEPIEDLVFSPNGTRLHIVTTAQDDLCLLDGSQIHSAEWDTRNRGIWVTHPGNTAQMLLITCGSMRIYSWSKLQQITSAPIQVDFDLSPEFELKAVYTGWGDRILITEYSDSIRVRSMTRFFLWDVASLTPTTTSIKPHTALQSFGDRLASLIGTQGTMIECLNGSNSSVLFLNHDGWICSVNMEDRLPEHYQRHFFLPNDWLSTNDQVLIRCTRSNEIVFVKEDEVAIIRRGLDCVELMPFEALS